MDYHMTYILCELTCMFVVLATVVNMNKNVGNIQEIRLFRMMQGSLIFVNSAQIVWAAYDMGYLRYSAGISWLVNFFCLMGLGVEMFLWFLFIAEQVKIIREDVLYKYAVRMQILVLAVHLILMLSSIVTKKIFYVETTGVYHRGPWYGVHVVLCYSNLIWTLILMIRCSRKRGIAVRNKINNLFLVAIFPTIGGILQIIFYGVPLTDCCVTISTLLIFISMQEDQITTDALTGLYNRSKFLDYYDHMIRNADSTPFLLFIAGVNYFKGINDTYGHSEGDQALLLIVEVFRNLEDDYKSMRTCRYGGDEFIIVIHESEVEDAGKIEEKINGMIENSIREKQKKYSLSLGMGYQLVNNSLVDPAKVIQKADEMLYEQKAKR